MKSSLEKDKKMRQEKIKARPRGVFTDEEWTLKASLTVEASLVVSICMLILGHLMMFGFHVWDESLDTVYETKSEEENATERFRRIKAGQEVLSLYTDGT